jgi:DNA mismatch repair protein MutS
MSDIFQEYVDLTRQYRAKYGPKTVVLLQVGVFFEVYGFIDIATLCVYSPLTPIAEYAQVCNLNIMDKKSAGDKRIMYNDDWAVIGAGFRDYSIERYLQKLVTAGYTAVTYVQDEKVTGKNMTRRLDAVYSPGTYLSTTTDDDVRSGVTNNICCLWLEMIHHRATRSGSRGKREPSTIATNLVFGVAVANMFTGTSSLCEWVQPYSVDPSACDKLERIMTVNAPSEIIVISNVEPAALSDMLQFSGVVAGGSVVIHHVDLNTSTTAKRATEQKYIRHLLTNMYGSNAVDVCQEFTDYPTATQSYCYLVDFIQEHNPNLVKNIRIPQFQQTERVLLANHTLRQLNIPELETLLNQCVTAMGKRVFHEQLTHPTTDAVWLEREYRWTQTVLDLGCDAIITRQRLKEMRDMEKMARLLVVRKLTPLAMIQMHKTLSLTVLILSEDIQKGGLVEYFDAAAGDTDLGDLRRRVDAMIAFLLQTFLVRGGSGGGSGGEWGDLFICPGVSEVLDKTVREFEANHATFHAFHQSLNALMQQSKPGDTTEYVRIHETDKSGLSLQITKKRAILLRQRLSDNGSSRGWTVKSSTGANDEVTCPELVQVTSDMQRQKDRLQQVQHEAFLSVLVTMEEQFYDTMASVARFIGSVDVLLCKAHIARQFKYCKPTLATAAAAARTKSFVRAKQLRHPLIERLQSSSSSSTTTYVANDMDIGCDRQDGILLYGTNAVGKTSIIRALGMAVIMAQAGLFVPCSEFVFQPYTAIFSRILANDNLFKGLSTFVVEMSELRVILKMADENSLVLGDELCSGTETESALSIFVAGLMHLQRQQSSFIFATHFHEIVRFDEIQDMGGDTLRLKHMTVHYDRERDGLVYDRLLRDGPGDRMYGLEVCKSLHLPQEFLDTACQLRTKYFPTSRGDLAHNTSVYNCQKIRGRCEMCTVEVGTEIHHVVPQHLADDDGFVQTDRGVFHKNHVANLQSLCESCHLKTHQEHRRNPKR